MKFFYIANIRFPTERAHGVQVAHMCAAFAHTRIVTKGNTNSHENVEVELIVPERKNALREDPFDYYGVQRNFNITHVPVPDTVRFGTLGFLFESLFFAYQAARRVRGEHTMIVYTREEFPFLFLPKGTRAFYEAHQRRGPFVRGLIAKAAGIIAITQGLKDALVRDGYPEERILVAHDAVDLEQFSISFSKEEARKRLGLPSEGRLVLYIGGFETWKGLKTVLLGSKTLQERGIRVAVVGGSPAEVSALQKQYRDVHFLGQKPYTQLPLIQRAADVLVIPNSGKERISREFTSPLKLFAHMASGVPIVASDLPSLSEVLSEREALFFTPDDADSLVSAILKAFAPGAQTLARAAMQKVRGYTWNKRAMRILSFLLNTRAEQDIVSPL